MMMFGIRERDYAKARREDVQRSVGGWDHRSEDNVEQTRKRAAVLSTLSTIFVLMLAFLRKY